MVEPLTDEEILKAIPKIVKKYLPDARVILYGSRARGDYKPNSDFDIAVDNKGRAVEPATIYLIREELDNLPTLKSFDVVDLNSVSEEFRKLILKEGIELG